MTPKFKLGDKVWLIYNYKAIQATVTGVHHTCKYDGTEESIDYTERIYYNIYPELSKTYFDERFLYASREELLKSL